MLARRVLRAQLRHGTASTRAARTLPPSCFPPLSRALSLWPSSSAPPPSPPPPPPAPVSEFAPEPVPASEPPALPEGASEPTLLSSVPPDLASTTLTESTALAGLTSMGFLSWPAGLSALALTALQSSSGLSMTATIVLGTLAARMMVAPISVIQVRNSAKLQPFAGELQEIKKAMSAAQLAGDKDGVRAGVLAQKAVHDKAGVGLAGMLVLPFAQLPITLGMFFGVRRIMDAPLPALHDSGLAELVPAWADLSVADPYYALPLAGAVLMNGALSVFARDWGATADRKTVGLMLLAFRGLSVVGLPITASFSLGLNLHILTGSLAMACQTLILRAAPVRRLLGIPPLPPRDPHATVPNMKECVGYAREWLADKKAQAEAQAIAAQDARQMRMGGKSMQEKRAEGEGKRRVLEEISAARKPPQKW